MENEFSFSELTNVLIKATQPIELNGRTFTVGETVAAFDKVMNAAFHEDVNRVNAHGGKGDRARVWWQTTKDVRISLVQGIFSRTQLGFLYNTKVLKEPALTTVQVFAQEQTESDEDGNVKFAHVPIEPIFVYDGDTGARITGYSTIDEDHINIGQAYKNVLLDYPWEYANGYSTFISGRQLTNGTFTMTAQTKVKDDITGQVKTGILRIPKLKLMSDLSISLGSKATPIVGRMDAMACPVGPYGQECVMEILFLNDDIDGDI